MKTLTPVLFLKFSFSDILKKKQDGKKARGIYVKDAALEFEYAKGHLQYRVHVLCILQPIT